MGILATSGGEVGTALRQMLMADDIEPGSEPSYHLCKIIYTYHPLGKKMADSPITMAMSQEREITVPDGPESRLVEAFKAERTKLKIDNRIANLGSLSRIYGISSMGTVTTKYQSNQPIPANKLADIDDLTINVWDPLNTSGSLVLNQQPNEVDFMKPSGLRVAGLVYAPGRTVTLLHEQPIYISYTNSAFGFVGRSVYQRGLYPLQSFVQSMKTDNMIVVKAGVLIAKIKQAGSIISNAMRRLFGFKAEVVKDAQTGNVITIGTEGEEIETLNMQNLDAPYAIARKNILENIAVSADMPAKLLNSETFAEGFGEGTEDAKNVARFVDGIRIWLQPAYEFTDALVQYRAWNEDFYKTIQNEFPDEYGKVPYATAFMRWVNSFRATWPSLLIEPESELAKKEDVKFKAVVAIAELLLPVIDPINKATVVKWMADNANDNKMLFSHPLDLDYEVLAQYVPPTPLAPDKEPEEAPPFSERA